MPTRPYTAPIAFSSIGSFECRGLTRIPFYVVRLAPKPALGTPSAKDAESEPSDCARSVAQAAAPAGGSQNAEKDEEEKRNPVPLRAPLLREKQECSVKPLLSMQSSGQPRHRAGGAGGAPSKRMGEALNTLP